MEIGSNTLNEQGELMNLDWDDEEDIETAQEPTQEEYENGDQYEESEEEPDLLGYLLRDKGITDPNKIKFADENDQIQERSWNDLSLEEQYNILSQQPEQEQPSVEDALSDEEIQLLNAIRQNNLSPSEFINLSIQQGVQNYINNQPGPSYEVDEFTDDDLYVADLKIRTPNITDEELTQALETAKSNPELFAKQIEGLREEYKALEDQNKQEEAAIYQQQTQEQYQEFANTIYDNIEQLNAVGGLDIELEDEDKEDLAEFILGQDQAGINHFQKALQDPATLTQIAWFLLKGQDTIDGIIDYFTKEITKVRENSFKKGQESVGKPQVVVTKPKKPVVFSQGQISSIDDLD